MVLLICPLSDVSPAGDPTTPGIPAYEGSNRTAGSNGPRIPSLPISWANAERLLEEIDGARRTLSGAASAKSVRLVNHVDVKVTPIWNTMAAIPGHVRDEVVVIGCHRDGACCCCVLLVFS